MMKNNIYSDGRKKPCDRPHKTQNENTSYHNKKSSKAQISIEFIGGFGLFITVVIYVAYTAMVVFPKHFDESNENAIREEAWTLSAELMNYLKNGTQVNNQPIASLSRCKIYHHFDETTKANYSYFKELFNVDNSNDFHISVKSNPVIITDNVKGQNKTGNMTIDNIEYVFELFNGTSLKYDSVHVWNSSATIATTDENGTAQLGEYTYSIDKIDSSGKYIILGVELVDCGKYTPATMMSAKIRRFTTYKNFITTIDVAYW